MVGTAGELLITMDKRFKMREVNYFLQSARVMPAKDIEILYKREAKPFQPLRPRLKDHFGLSI